MPAPESREPRCTFVVFHTVWPLAWPVQTQSHTVEWVLSELYLSASYGTVLEYLDL
eukprot:COSAG03_NODE_20754_length_314_cov_0.958140_1_plen_56_part_00